MDGPNVCAVAMYVSSSSVNIIILVAANIGLLEVIERSLVVNVLFGRQGCLASIGFGKTALFWYWQYLL